MLDRLRRKPVQQPVDLMDPFRSVSELRVDRELADPGQGVHLAGEGNAGKMRCQLSPRLIGELGDVPNRPKIVFEQACAQEAITPPSPDQKAAPGSADSPGLGP